MTVYDSPGKARKQCPNCQKYIHARSLICGNCKTILGKKKTIDKPEPQVYNEPGRGRKLCICNKYIGAKNKQCPSCGSTKFVKREQPVVQPREKKPVEAKKLDEPVSKNYVGSLVLTPAGSCPIKLSSQDKEGVLLWCEETFRNGLKQNKTYTVDALKYWFNHFNLPHLKVYINEWCFSEGYEKGSSDNREHEEYTDWENETLQLLDS